jgi:hypothetical protein
MLTLARLLSMLSVISTAIFIFVAIGVGRLHFLQIGFEATGAVATLSLISAALAAPISLLIVIVRRRLGEGAGSTAVVLTSATSLVVLGVACVISAI